LKRAVSAGPSAKATGAPPPATGVIVDRSALNRLTRLTVRKVKLPEASWTMPLVVPASAWSRRPLTGSDASIAVGGAVTVSSAAALVAALVPLQLSWARNCAPLSARAVASV